jgi:lytic cellulose monooxygenase (C1-hydroxylating)
VASQVDGAQFYPNYLQVQVVNGGSVTLPEGIPLPGSYDPYDPGILVELYKITPSMPNYTIPGTLDTFVSSTKCLSLNFGS